MVGNKLLCFCFLEYLWLHIGNDFLVSDECQWYNTQRHHNDFHLLRVFRHVQCTQLPITGIMYCTIMWHNSVALSNTNACCSRSAQH